jgi:hypothetical protein
MNQKPNGNGLFDLKNTALIARRLQCKIETPTNDYILTVVGGANSKRNSKATVTAVDAGLWDPVDIIAACRIATGSTTLKASAWLTENPGGLDELRIAKILGAAGAKTYWKNASEKWDHKLRETVIVPAGTATDTFKTIIHTVNGRPRRVPFPMQQLDKYGPIRHTKFFDSLQLLEFLGLLKIQRRPRGGTEMARISWLPLAYPQARTPAPVEILHDDDEHALDCLAAGLPVGRFQIL